MQTRNLVLRILRFAVLALLGFAAVLHPRLASGSPQSSAAPGEIVLNVDPDKSQVHWTLDSTLHTVHGTFKFKSGSLHFDPATRKAGGEIIVAATSGESDNEGRDKKMHKDVLESSRYPDIVFRPDRVDGKVASPGTSTVQLHGTFTLHGAEHEMTFSVQSDLAAGHWKASCKFSIPFIQWGLKNPSNFFLKVKPDVNVDLDLQGPLQPNTSTH